jgi:hypothetical protein
MWSIAARAGRVFLSCGALLAACSSSGAVDAVDAVEHAGEVEVREPDPGLPEAPFEVVDVPRELDTASEASAEADPKEAGPEDVGPGDPDGGPDALPDPGAEPAADWADAGPDAEPEADAEPEVDAGGEVCPACAAYGAVTTTGTLGSPALTELSGLAPSRVHPGVYYAHADSGDSARFFAFELDGTLRGEYHLAPAPSAVDWEDLSIGPCDAGSCLYLGDVGDNTNQRTSYVVYVVPEPLVLDVVEPADVAFTALPFRYPDGPHNSETLFVHPQTGDVYVVIKAASDWGVYRMPTPHTPGQEAVLVKVGSVPSPGFLAVATGGDVHPCGTRVLLRSYGQLVELRLGAGQVFDDIFENVGVPVAVGNEPQGEAVCYDADGLGYVTVSEGANRPVYHVGCE